MDALTDSDLMKRQEAKLIGVNRYTLTPAGERAGCRFCYGHREILSVPSFTPPLTVNGQQVTTVTYRYRLGDFAGMGEYRRDARRLSCIGKGHLIRSTGHCELQLTINGWEMADSK